MTWRRLRLLAGYALLGSVACGEPLGPDGDGVERVEVVPVAAQLVVGDTRTATARALNSAGETVTDRRIFWSTQNPAIATVNQSGVITAASVGVTQVAASVGGKSGIVQVTVSSRPVSQVRMVPATAQVQTGATTQLRADPVDATGTAVTGRPVIWASSSSATATVTSTGLVTGVAAGSANITATVDGVVGTTIVTVTPIPVATVTVSPGTGTVIAGQTLQLSATTASATGQTLSGRVVTWASSSSTVATVSSTGLVTGVAAGVVTLTATSEGRSGTARITVTDVPVAEVRVSPNTATVASGRTVQLTAVAVDANNTVLPRAVTWTSDQPGIATVNSAGLVTGIGNGAARISATAGGVSGAATVTVTPVPVATVRITPNGGNLVVGRTLNLAAEARDAQDNVLPGRVITWISGAPTVATVAQDGVVTAIGPGSAVIFAATEGVSASVTITVSNVGVASVQINPPSGSLGQGQSLQLAATARDAAGNILTGRTVVWSSSNETIATVGSTGRVVGIAAGTATITATVDGVSASGQYTVTPLPVGIVSVSPATSTLIAGQTVQLSVNLFAANGTPLASQGRIVTWSSVHPTIATVNASGLVTALANGQAAINATVEGVIGSALVTVAAIPVASVTLAPASVTLNQGQTQAVTATARDAQGNVLTGRPVTWSSSDPTRATVNTSSTGSSNTITAVAAGSATISAVVGGVQGVSAVTVTAIPIASIAVTPTPTNVVEGNTVTLTATARDASNNVLTGRTIVWASNNPQVSVSQAGVVTAVVNSAGQSATITASSPGGGAGGSTPQGTATVNVGFAPVATVGLSPSTGLSVQLGSTVSGFALSLQNSTGQTLNTAGRVVTWTSLNPAIATVNPSTGAISGVAAGSTQIQVSVASPGQSPAITAQAPFTVSTVPVAFVEVLPSTGTVHVGTLYRRLYTATARDAGGNVLAGRVPVWTSNALSVATVDAATGEVTGVSLGTARITATVEGVSGFVDVSTSLVPVSTVVVTPATATLNPSVNPTQTLTSSPRDSANNVISGAALGGRTRTWASSNAGVATVNPTTGLVTAVAAGSAVMTATFSGPNGGQGTASITVIPPVANVALSIAPDTLILPGTLSGTVTLTDAGSQPLTGRTVTLTSAQPSQATVSPASATSNGAGQVAITLTGGASGNGTPFNITATSEGISQTFPVKMLNRVNSVSFPAAVDSVIGTGTAASPATVTLRDAANVTLTGRPITYTSSNPAVATVPSAPTTSTSVPVTVVGFGSTTIGASAEGRSGSYTFNVLQPVNTVTLTTAGDSVIGTGTLPVTATLRDVNNAVLTGRPITWSVAPPMGIATVSSTGVVTGVAPGTATVTASVEGRTGQVILRVLPPIAAIALTPALDSLIGPGTINLTATATASGGAPIQGRTLAIVSSDPTRATVSPASGVTDASGQVTLTLTQVAFGNTTLSVSAEGQSANRLMRFMPPVASVALSAPADSIIGTGTLQLTATLRDATNAIISNPRVVSFAPLTNAAADMTATGLITGKGNTNSGTVNYTATSEGVTSPNFAVRILRSIASAIWSGPATVNVTQNVTLDITVSDGSAAPLAGRVCTVTNNTPALATIPTGAQVSNLSGVISVSVTGVAAGAASFTAQCEGVTSAGGITVQ